MENKSINPPLISIIITVLNGANYLQKALESIEKQTFSDYELVLVDGGSEDGSDRIAMNSLIKNKTVHVVPGLGLYAGLNFGITLSRGMWLYFMGADDKLYNLDTLSSIADILRFNSSQDKIYIGNVNFIKQNILFIPTLGSPYFMHHVVHHQGMFYDRHLFNNSRYNEDMKISADYEFNLNLALSGIKYKWVDIIICNFGGDGISENQARKGYLEMQEAHGRLFKGISKLWVMSYFWLRRSTSKLLMQNNLFKIRNDLKRFFG